jgi:predicted DNA-binding transcriptional regulator AlpA
MEKTPVVNEPYETAKEIAVRLHVKPQTVYDWASRRENPLPARRITNKHTLFLPSEVRAWVNAGGTLRPKSAKKAATAARLGAA